MKVVLFCGGQGLRMRDNGSRLPKPMASLGGKPLLCHLMQWYAHYGHREFILCLGHGADDIKDHFLRRNPAASGNFKLDQLGLQPLKNGMQDWSITFVDTGLASNLGTRLSKVRPYLGTDETFLANYADGLSDVDLNAMITSHQNAGATASFLAVRPSQSFHVIEMNPTGGVSALRDVTKSDLWINGGFFVLNRRIFDVLRPGEELVEQPFARLIEQEKLQAIRHQSFWKAVDTFKDLTEMESLLLRGNGPWEVWNQMDMDQAAE